MDRLSPIDQKVLGFVSLNGINVSEREIAKKLRLSQATVNYSLKKLEEKKIIKGYLFRLNYDAIGFGAGAWVFFVLHRQCIDLDAFIKKISEFPEIQLLAAVNGEYDFCIRVVGKSAHSLFDSIMEIEKAIAPLIEHTTIVLISKTFKSHQIILPEKPDGKKLDDISRKILSYRIDNPKSSIGELCSALKIHRNTAIKKWRELFERGIILKKGVILSPEAAEQLGIGFKAMVFFNVAPDKKGAFSEAIVSYPEVHELFSVAGHHDFLAIVRTKDQRELFNFHQNLLCNPLFSNSVHKTISRVILFTKNINYDPKKIIENNRHNSD